MSGKDWGEVDATSGFEDKVKLRDKLPIIDKQDFKDTFKEYRFIGGVQPYQEIWLPIYKDGKPVLTAKSKQPVRVPFFVTNYDLENHKTDESKPACPYVEVADKMNKYLPETEQLRIKQAYLACAIDREFQENPPRKIIPPTKAETKAGFYDMDSPSTKWVAVFDMTPTLFRKVKGLKDLNKIKDKKSGETKTYHVTDPRKGCNVNIKFSPKEKGGAMYDAQKSERAPLTEEEQEYLTWDISSPIVPDDYKTAKKEADRLWKEFAKSLKNKGKDDDDDSDDDMPDDLEDDDDKPVKKGKGKDKVKAKKKPDPDDDDDSDDEDDDDVKPVKKKAKSKVVDDDEDDDEEEKPLKKKSKVKAKVVDDDEDDEDPDVDLDDDEDEDEKPAKKKKASKKVIDDDEDEDEDEDEPVVKKSSKKAKKPDPDEDEDDEKDMEDLPEDEDDDEDEEVVVKKKTKKPLKKKRVVVDDDEDEDDDD